MSSKGDNDQLIERVRRSNNVSLITTTTVLPTSTSKSAQKSTISAVCDRNIEVSQSPSKVVNERRKNVPPYTNFNNAGSMSKSKKVNMKNTVLETSTNTVCMKPGVPIASPESGVLPNSSVSPSVSFSVISTSKTEKTNQPPKNSSEKTYSSFQSSNDDYNSSTLDGMKQIQSSFEKNIQSKALTVTHVSKPSQLTSNTQRETRTPNVISTPTSAKISTNTDHFKPKGNSLTVRVTNESKKCSVSSPRIPCATVMQSASKANSTPVNASELSINIPAKPSVPDVSTTVSSKKQSPGISSFSDAARCSIETSPNTPVKPILTASRLSKSITTNNSTPVSVQQTNSTEVGSINLRNIPSILSSVTGKKDPDYMKVMGKINAGDNVTFTPSVTISKPTFVTIPSLPVQKGRVGMTAEVTQKVSTSNTSPTSGNSRKHDNVTEVNSSSLSPGTDISRDTKVSSSPTGVVKYDSSSYMITDETEINEEMNSPKMSLQEEPECLTISSDEETEESEEFIGLSNKHEISFSVSNKEPPLVEKNEKLSVAADGSTCDSDEESALDKLSGDGYVSLNCRTVRIGSLKLSPHVPVILSKFGLRIVIPNFENVVLKIPIREFTRVLCHFGESIPVIFYYVTENMGALVRKILKMDNPEVAYFDPNSSSECQRRITLLPEHISDTNAFNIREIFKDTSIMRDLSHEEANEILLRSAPKEIQRVVKQQIQQVPDPVQTIMVFPPPPAKGGISINTEDYSCLARDVFLNDVIIDFYLKYLYLNHLSEEDREKTHIFSSFFYKRLTDKATPMPRHLKSGEGVITAAEIRHSRVKNWTKNIDIFSKDYIVIPLNENQHWFLAIICFPGLRGPVRFSDNSPIEVEPKKKVADTDEDFSITADSEKPSSSIGSVTITPVKIEIKEKTKMFLDDDNDAEDRDEAEATDEDVNISEEDTDEEYVRSGIVKDLPKPKTKTEREPIKQPCILIFDSLAGASRARIIATLRDYLRIEYKTKHGEDLDFSKNVVKGSVPSVPQQDNFTDCGLFVLQYVEAFFDTKITDYHIPIKTLRSWFHPGIVSSKRYRIKKLLHELMEAQDIDVENLKLPTLHLSPSDDEDDDYDIDSEEFDEEDYYTEEYEDDELHSLTVSRHGYRGHEVRELYNDEDDYDDDDEESPTHDSQYEIYDEEEANEDMDSDEDGDFIYGNLEPSKMEEYQMHCMVSEGSEEDEEIEENMCEEEEEEEGGEEEEEGELPLSSDIQEKINKSNLNRGAVSIQKIPINSRTFSSASSSSNSHTATVTSTTPNIKSKQVDVAKFKQIRPWKTTNQSNDDCSSVKKFKPN